MSSDCYKLTQRDVDTLKETYYAFLVLQCYVGSRACNISWTVEAPLSHRNHCSWNASPSVPTLIP